MPEITGIAHVELSVRDLDRSVEWYTTLLNARDVWRGSSDEYGITACAIFEPNSRMVLAFTRHNEQEPEPFSPRRPGLDHVSFGVADRERLLRLLRPHQVPRQARRSIACSRRTPCAGSS